MRCHQRLQFPSRHQFRLLAILHHLSFPMQLSFQQFSWRIPVHFSSIVGLLPPTFANVRKGNLREDTSSNSFPRDPILNIDMKAPSAATFTGRTFESLAQETTEARRDLMCG